MSDYGDTSCCLTEPPEILTTESNISVKIYSDAYLDCVVYGNPSPQVIWLNSGMQINLTQPRFSILDNGTLHISGVLVEDGGVYQCLASNIGGSASKNTTLHVLCMFVTNAIMCYVGSALCQLVS